MQQTAPDPTELYDLVANLSYKPGWTFELIEDFERDPGSYGLTFFIHTFTQNSNPPHADYCVTHLFIVPAATYDRRSWQHWLFEQFVKVETHEASEFFKVDGVRPYVPTHKPGSDPYMVLETAVDDDSRVNFRGERVAT